VVERGSVLEVKAGELTKQIAEPWVDLCSDCSSGFTDWLKSGRQTHHDGLGGATADTAVASMAMA
jgi:hypothetical protein